MDDRIKSKILEILDQHRITSIATLRPDGWPQATTVGYASDGLTLYFLCGKDSQKASNLARDDRVSLTKLGVVAKRHLVSASGWWWICSRLDHLQCVD